jgi:signal transduction histidine kinase
MVETMNSFLGYYKQDSNFSTFEIKDNIKQVLQLIDIEIKNSKIKINIIDNFPLFISANKNEWLHIWLNLITNSIKVSKFHNIQNPFIKIVINENSIIYEDNCKGFEKEVLKNVQEFKQQGLGLKMSFKILNKSNWSMGIENSNDGAKFTIFDKNHNL